MKMTLLLVFTLFGGIALGILLPEISSPLLSNGSLYILYALLLFVGIDIGISNKNMGAKKLLSLLKTTGFIVLGTVFGSLLGGAVAGIITGLPLNQGLAVACGFAWYSLSGVLIANLSSAELGAVAFVSNVLREAFVFISVPFLCRKGFNKYASISIAGASSMDVSLTVISKYTDANTSAVSFLHGVILSALVPILVPLMLSF